MSDQGKARDDIQDPIIERGRGVAYLWFSETNGWQVTSFDPVTNPAIGFKPETKLYIIKTAYDQAQAEIEKCSKDLFTCEAANDRLNAEIEELKERMALVKEGGSSLNKVLLDENETLKAKLEIAREALEFYAPKENWEQFLSGGGIFETVEGDFCEAFENADNNGPDSGDTARDALAKIKGEKDE